MGPLRLCLFGSFTVALDNAHFIDFEYDKVRALLAFLSIESHRTHRRDELCGLLWPTDDQQHARQSLNQAVYSLRRSLARSGAETDYLLSDRSTVGINSDADWCSDVGRFERLLHQAESSGEAEEGAALRAQAADIYRGPFLEGFHLPDSVAWDEWVLLQQERLHGLARTTLRELTAHHQQSSQLEEALGWAQRLLALDNWDEASHRLVMRLLAGLGRRSQALAQFERCRQLLRDELGAEPSQETLDLHAALLAGDGAVQPGSAPRAAVPSNLPTPRTGFVGRERELAQIERRLADPECRLLTIVGMGGAGKTQLALHGSRACRKLFADGIVFAPLVAVNDKAGLLSAISSGLGGPSNPTLASVGERLRPLRLLLVLDNCEQLRPVAPLFAQLLADAPELKILATSRERLNLHDEWLLPLEGLPLPQTDGDESATVQPASLYASDSSRLFINCLRRMQPGLELTPTDAAHIVRICSQVAGLPLALELVATWNRYLPLSQIVERTGQLLNLSPMASADLPTRHRSIGAIFDHSWALLSDATAERLRLLSLFRGGFTLEAAETVAGAGLAELAELIDRCWVWVDESGRYNLHELVRQYCAEQLESQGEEIVAEARRRHAVYFSALLAPQEDRYNRVASSLAEITPEIGNVEAAWDWVTAAGEADIAQPLFMSVFYIAAMWGWYGLGEAFFQRGYQRLLAHLRAEEQSEEQRQAIVHMLLQISHGQGSLYFQQGRLAAALAAVEQGEQLARHSARNPQIDFIYHYIRNLRAAIRGRMGCPDEGEMILRQETIPYFENAPSSIYMGRDFSLGNSYRTLGAILMVKGDYSESWRILETALDYDTRSGSSRQKAITCRLMAFVQSALGAQKESLDYAAESVRLSREYDDQVDLSLNLSAQGDLLLRAGDRAAARQACQESLSIARPFGNQHYGWAAVRLGAVELADGYPSASRSLADDALARFQREALDDISLHAEILLLQGRCAQATGKPQEAAALFRQAPELPNLLFAQRRAAEEALNSLT